MDNGVIGTRLTVGGRWLSWTHDDLHPGPAPLWGPDDPAAVLAYARTHRAAEEDEARQVI